MYQVCTNCSCKNDKKREKVIIILNEWVGKDFFSPQKHLVMWLEKIHFRTTFFLVGLLTIYICIIFFYLNGYRTIFWWLMLLMIPLYIAVRITEVNEKPRKWILNIILAIVLIEAIWVCCNFMVSHDLIISCTKLQVHYLLQDSIRK